MKMELLSFLYYPCHLLQNYVWFTTIGQNDVWFTTIGQNDVWFTTIGQNDVWFTTIGQNDVWLTIHHLPKKRQFASYNEKLEKWTDFTTLGSIKCFPISLGGSLMELVS
jgi:hypothetical protein